MGGAAAIAGGVAAGVEQANKSPKSVESDKPMPSPKSVESDAVSTVVEIQVPWSNDVPPAPPADPALSAPAAYSKLYDNEKQRGAASATANQGMFIGVTAFLLFLGLVFLGI